MSLYFCPAQPVPLFNRFLPYKEVRDGTLLYETSSRKWAKSWFDKGHLILWGKNWLQRCSHPVSLPTRLWGSPCQQVPGNASMSRGGGRTKERFRRAGVLVPGWFLPCGVTARCSTGVKLTLPGAQLPPGKHASSSFTASLGETSSLHLCFKTIEPSQGMSLEVKCSTILNCVPRSPGIPRAPNTSCSPSPLA